MLWISLTLVLLALATLRYAADSRDGRNRNPFAPRGATDSDVPSAFADGYHRAHTPADDLAALTRAARVALHRIRRTPKGPERVRTGQFRAPW
jgi:hypothetical protein